MYIFVLCLFKHTHFLSHSDRFRNRCYGHCWYHPRFLRRLLGRLFIGCNTPMVCRILLHIRLQSDWLDCIYPLRFSGTDSVSISNRFQSPFSSDLVKMDWTKPLLCIAFPTLLAFFILLRIGFYHPGPRNKAPNAVHLCSKTPVCCIFNVHCSIPRLRCYLPAVSLHSLIHPIPLFYTAFSLLHKCLSYLEIYFITTCLSQDCPTCKFPGLLHLLLWYDPLCAFSGHLLNVAVQRSACLLTPSLLSCLVFTTMRSRFVVRFSIVHLITQAILGPSVLYVCPHNQPVCIF